MKRLADAAKEATGLETRVSASSCSANAERDLHRSVAAEGWLKIRPYYVEIPVRRSRKEIITVRWPVLLPHQMFAELARRQLLTFILGMDGAGEWWRLAREAGAKVAQHPMVKDRADLGNVIPIRLHGVRGLAKPTGACFEIYLHIFIYIYTQRLLKAGDVRPTEDGGSYKRNQALHLWQWSSALVHQDAWRSRILICAKPSPQHETKSQTL